MLDVLGQPRTDVLAVEGPCTVDLTALTDVPTRFLTWNHAVWAHLDLKQCNSIYLQVLVTRLGVSKGSSWHQRN